MSKQDPAPTKPPASPKIRLLYLGMYFDYGDARRGLSFEETNFHAGLMDHPDVEVTHFDFVELHHQLGAEKMNRLLLENALSGDFDALFCVTYEDQLDPTVISKISESPVTTIGWGCDDHWRFQDYSKEWAPHFNHWVTTARSSIERFAELGYDNLIKSQWAFAPAAYPDASVRRDLGLTFIGLPHGNRPQIMKAIGETGIDLTIAGHGWYESSRLDHRGLVDHLNRSKICLNLSNASTNDVQQIKGRVFEVTGCGSLLLTDDADDLASYFEPGKEIVVYDDLRDLVAKAEHYIENDDERERIAEAARRRTLREHTWKHRFDDIFKATGLVEEPRRKSRGIRHHAVDGLLFPRNDKKVSICVPSYNYHKHTERLIKSVISQTHTEWELNIVDDASTDLTPAILKRFEKHPKIDVVLKEENSGMVATLGESFDMATGDYVFGMNADDFLQAGALELMTGYLEKYQEFGMVFTDFYRTDPDSGKPIGLGKKYPVNAEMLLEKNHIRIWSAIWHKKAFEKTGYPEFEQCCDWDMWLKISEHYEIAHLPLPCVSWWDDGTSYYYRGIAEGKEQAKECVAAARKRRGLTPLDEDPEEE